jgi:hypothetical protein
MYASSLADDARMTYEYGLRPAPMSNDFSFVDQRVLPIRYYPTANRSYSMPQQFEPEENFMNRSFVNSQQGLADQIQSVRHLWERENSSQYFSYR